MGADGVLNSADISAFTGVHVLPSSARYIPANTPLYWDPIMK